MFCGQLQVPYESSMYKLPLLSISNFFKKLKNLCQFVKNFILKFAFIVLLMKFQIFSCILTIFIPSFVNKLFMFLKKKKTRFGA